MSLWIDYTNYRGERSIRQITVMSAVWGSNEYHPEPQVIVNALDHGKSVIRSFTLKDIHGWYPTEDVAKAAQPGAGVGDPSIFADAVEIIGIVLEEREEDRGGEDEVLRCLLDRFKALAPLPNGGDSGSEEDLKPKAQTVPCIWDTDFQGYVPTYSHRGVELARQVEPSAPVGASKGVTDVITLDDLDFNKQFASGLADPNSCGRDTVSYLMRIGGTVAIDYSKMIGGGIHRAAALLEWFRRDRELRLAQAQPASNPNGAGQGDGSLCARVESLETALKAYDEYAAVPADRGGRWGPKGKAFMRFVQLKDAALAPSPDSGSATAAREIGGETPVRWGSPRNVAELVAQLRTLPQDAPIWGTFGPVEGRGYGIRGVTISRERVVGRWIDAKSDAPYQYVIWTKEAPSDPAVKSETASVGGRDAE